MKTILENRRAALVTAIYSAIAAIKTTPKCSCSLFDNSVWRQNRIYGIQCHTRDFAWNIKNQHIPEFEKDICFGFDDANIGYNCGR